MVSYGDGIIIKESMGLIVIFRVMYYNLFLI